ncbi:MAG: PorP/SprF family type IX secretion system membrane protein [Cyclobacteriaceae bacterium]
MKLRILTIATTILVMSLSAFGQQRPITSTYAYNGLLLNPAYAGSLNVLSVIGVYRKQWINVEGAPQLSAISAHSSFMSNRIGAGFYLTDDKVGVTNDIALYGSYAYKIKTKIGILAMGIQGGFNQRKSDFTDGSIILLNDDPLLSGIRSNFSPNFGTGVYFANPVFYAGASIPYLVENKTTKDLADLIPTSDEISNESRYYYVTSGLILRLSDAIKISPSVLLRLQEQARVEWDFAGHLIFDEIAYIGINVRNTADVTLFGQVIMNENLRIGYAYDATTNGLKDGSAGSHEIMVNYRIKLKNYRKDPQCPVYF